MGLNGCKRLKTFLQGTHGKVSPLVWGEVFLWQISCNPMSSLHHLYSYPRGLNGEQIEQCILSAVTMLGRALTSQQRPRKTEKHLR